MNPVAAVATAVPVSGFVGNLYKKRFGNASTNRFGFTKLPATDFFGADLLFDAGVGACIKIYGAHQHREGDDQSR